MTNKVFLAIVLLVFCFIGNVSAQCCPDYYQHYNTQSTTLLPPVPCTGYTYDATNWAATHNSNLNNTTITEDPTQAARVRNILARTTAVNPIRGLNYQGNLNDGSATQDNSIAVSNGGYVVSVSSSRIHIYSPTGALAFSSTLNGWLPYGARGMARPQVLYDVTADRFVFACESYPISDTGKIFVAFSRSGVPTASWSCYMFNGDPFSASLGFDYPRIAINDSEMFLAGNMYSSPTSSPSFSRPLLYQMDKRAGYAGTSISSVYYNYIYGNPQYLLPVSHGQSTHTTGMYLISTLNGGGNTYNLYKITGNWSSSPSMTSTTIYTTAYNRASPAPQQGSSDALDVSDCRAQSAFFLAGKIHFVFTADAGSGLAGIRYHRVNTMTNADSFRLFTTTGISYAYPSVVSYATSLTDPTVMIGCVSSSASSYPDVRVINCDSALNWSSTTLVKSSTTYIAGTSGSAAWGLYTGTARKHNSTTPSIWMNGMYPNSGHVCETWIAEIHDSLTTPCPVPVSIASVSVTSTTARVSWTAVAGSTYNVFYRPVGGTTWGSATAATSPYTITSLTPNTHYEYKIQTVCPGPNYSDSSAVNLFTTPPPATITTPNGTQQLSLYPNPATDKANIDFNISQPASYKVQLTDLAGKPLPGQMYSGTIAGNTHSLTLPLVDLPQGLYFVTVWLNGAQVKTEKIVVVK
ncbi:MAG: T9SS C-terminal target domain-containing protein [Chitinophagia bacterium]|nr:T9SS C-terminal target domain-containing protein [Chitinophagia bacterium]